MTDFKAALAAGLTKAHQINLNKQQVDDKFDQISKMLYDGTSGAVGLVFSDNVTHNETFIGNKVQNVHAVSQIDTSIGTKIATVIRNQDSGYPVTIESPHYRFVCSSVEEIEVAFSEIVQMNTVANAIFSLCNIKTS